MERRDLLRSAALATAGTVGLAGCSRTDADDTDYSPVDQVGDGVCPTPGETLADSFPNSDAYERQETVTTTDGSSDEDVEQTAYALYWGPDGERYYFEITVFDSEGAAINRLRWVRAEGGHENGALGVVRVGRVVYFARGPDEQAVRAFMRTSALTGACLANRFETLHGTATPTPV